jgi:hypothetical protein
MYREPISLRNLPMRAMLQDQNMCDLIIETVY